jgi:hypothetical protein
MVFRSFGILLSIIGGFLLYESIRSKKIFVSYKFIGDAKYKNLLKAWSKNHKFSVTFDDVSTDISINSHDEEVIKNSILPHIESADIFLCIIGSKTHESKMVEWEIQKAVQLKKKIVAVKVRKNNTTPPALKNVGASWAMRFSEKQIMKALQEAL